MLKPRELEKIEPFEVTDLVDYNPAFLAGFQAEIITESQELYDELADDKAIVHSDDIVRRSQKPFDVGYAHVLSEIEECSSPEIVLLPVWFARGNYKLEPFSIIINGQTKKTFEINPKKIHISIIAKIIGSIMFVLIPGIITALIGLTLWHGVSIALIILIAYFILSVSEPTYTRNLHNPINITKSEIIENNTYTYKEFKKLFPKETETSSLTKLKNGLYDEVESEYQLRSKYRN